MTRVLGWTLAALVLALAVALRVHLDRPLTTDEATYARAGELGFLANWLDAPGVRKMRHEHPPLMVFVQAGSVALVGRTEAALRVPSVVLGTLTVAVVLLGFRRAAPELPHWTAVPAAVLLAVFPAHVYASQWASWHAGLALLFAATALAMVRAFRTLDAGAFLTVWLGVAVGFAVMEYTLVLAAAVGLVLLLRPTPWLRVARGRRVRISRVLRTGLLLVAAVVGTTWGAGLLKLSLLRNLLHYVGYEEHPVLYRGAVTPDAPPLAYVDWYMQEMPAYLALFGLMAVAVTGLLVSRRWHVRHPVFPVVALFGLLLGALLLQAVVSTVYTVYAGLVALLLLPFLLAEAATAVQQAAVGWRSAVPAAAAGLTLAVALPTVPFAAREARPGATGYRAVAKTLIEEGAHRDPRPRVLAFYSPIVEWYEPRLDVDRYPRGELTPELFGGLREGAYEWVVLHSAQTRRWPDEPGARWVRRHGRLVAHEADRWGEIWLYRLPVAEPVLAGRLAASRETREP